MTQPFFSFFFSTFNISFKKQYTNGLKFLKNCVGQKLQCLESETNVHVYYFERNFNWIPKNWLVKSHKNYMYMRYMYEESEYYRIDEAFSRLNYFIAPLVHRASACNHKGFGHFTPEKTVVVHLPFVTRLISM